MILTASIVMAQPVAQSPPQGIENDSSGQQQDVLKAHLISTVKKEVKQIMEESVTRKFLHEDSACVISLCGAVEACLSHGLKRRALGLFKTSSTTALLHKIAKNCKEAATISRLVINSSIRETIDASSDLGVGCVGANGPSSSSSDSLNTKSSSVASSISPPSKRHFSAHMRYLWIRLALYNKVLATIIEHLVCNALKYYERDATVADPDYGLVLSALLVGPCALDYSRTRFADPYWTDPPADELVLRHRISSGGGGGRSFTNNSCSTTALEDGSSIAQDLHQNTKSTLLFGKNNVLVGPGAVSHAMPGYLSLHHQTMQQRLTLKWTPNQVINNGLEGEKSCCNSITFWDYALQVNLEDIVYVHCHQDEEQDRNTVILVGQDGVQQPPLHFPRGGHLLAFLSCLETGLLPHGYLDPPLWSHQQQKSRRRSALVHVVPSTTNDYVFRICNSSKTEVTAFQSSSSESTTSNSSIMGPKKSSGTDESSSNDQMQKKGPKGSSIKAVCDSMRRQIISRAFYGWLGYCRHLSTVRTHLSGLILKGRISDSGSDGQFGITNEKWEKLYLNGVLEDSTEVYRLTYFGGCANNAIRRELWPYLLGHYKFRSTAEERRLLVDDTKQAYESVLSEWMAAEVIVKQREKDATVKCVKFESTSSSTEEHDGQEEAAEDEEESKNPTVVSPGSSSGGGVYSSELLELWALNLHRIEKDVQRCDRNYSYFCQPGNLDKLQNVVCTYVWENLDVGYMQGMCDLVAPLLVIFNEESLAYACFSRLMGGFLGSPGGGMLENFPSGHAMDAHFANMRSLIQILDAEMYDLMGEKHSSNGGGSGDYTHLYFCYRWFLLDFKREFIYDDIFHVWEVIWGAQHLTSRHFPLFLALALLQIYRDIILANGMDFTDIIRFFNEMAERHNATVILNLARDLVHQLQVLIHNK